MIIIIYRKGDKEGTIRYFNKARDEYGVIPTDLMIGTIISAHARSMDTNGAMKYITLAKELKINLSLQSITAMINVFAEKGDRAGAIEWYTVKYYHYYYYLY